MHALLYFSTNVKRPSCVRKINENGEKGMAVRSPGFREATFFRVPQDGLSERGTTVNRNMDKFKAQLSLVVSLSS